MPTIKFFFLLSYSSSTVIWQTFFYFSFFEGEHTVRFVPKEEGVHYLHARLNGIHIPGSPFKLEVQGNKNNNNNLCNDHSSVAVGEVVIVVVSFNLKFKGGSWNVNAIEACVQIVNAYN